MADVLPEPEHKVPKVRVHEGPELHSLDVVVPSAVQNEVRDRLADGHQSAFVLGVGDGPIPDIRMLTSKGTHPTVLDPLIQPIPVSNTRLDKLLGSGSEQSEGWVQESRDKVQDILGGDGDLHAAIRERTHEDDTAEDFRTIVGGDVSGDHTSHRPINHSSIGQIQNGNAAISQTYHPAKIGLFVAIPK